MKLTKKQREEVEYLQQFGNFTVSDDDVREYIEATVHGGGRGNDKFSNNKLRNAKTRLNLTVTMWREDVKKGALTYTELLEDPQLQHPYIQRVISGLVAYDGRQTL